MIIVTFTFALCTLVQRHVSSTGCSQIVIVVIINLRVRLLNIINIKISIIVNESSSNIVHSDGQVILILIVILTG